VLDAGGESAAAFLMKCVLHFILTQPNPEESMRLASDAMLPLVLSDAADLVTVVGAMFRQEGRAAAEARSHAIQHAQDLARMSAERGPLNTSLRSSFEGKFRHFAQEARSLLHSK
jgi:hypothetical protein